MIHMQINLHAVSQARSNQPWRGLLSEGTNPSADRLQCYMRDILKQSASFFVVGWVWLARLIGVVDYTASCVGTPPIHTAPRPSQF